MLALHYSKGENLEKAEEYLIKAGEVAMKSAASSEAITYYQEGLKLYRDLSGKTADPEKISIMEKNIGSALFNKGQFAEAMPYFDNALAYYGVKSRENKMAVTMSVISGMIHLLIGLYLPWLKFKRIAAPREVELNKILVMQGECAAFISIPKFLILGFRLIKKLTFLDLAKTKNGIQQFTTLTIILSYGGISFALHRKTLKFIRQKVNRDIASDMINLAFAESVNNRYEGNWNQQTYNGHLVDDALGVGIIQETLLVYYHGFLYRTWPGPVQHSQ